MSERLRANRLTALALATLALVVCGCRSVHPEAQSVQPPYKPGAWHSVVHTPPADLPHIGSLDKANPAWWAKNLEDPKPPDWYLPKGKLRKFRWFLRNPFHNFDYYVIGVADKTMVRSGKHPQDVGNPNGGWNYAVTKYKRLRLPFLSFQGRKIEGYIGWGTGGNFGIALRKSHRQLPPRTKGAKKAHSGAPAMPDSASLPASPGSRPEEKFNASPG